MQYKRQVRHAHLFRNPTPPARRDREAFRDREPRPVNGTYAALMPAAEPQPSRDLRRRRFAEFARRAYDAAKSRGMTVEQIEQATSVGKSTIHRWMAGQWSRDPRASEVRSFCLGLGVSLEEAQRMLGWTQKPGAADVEPIMEDPDVRAVMRALNDPNVHPAVKLMIRRQLRALAAEAERP